MKITIERICKKGLLFTAGMLFVISMLSGCGKAEPVTVRVGSLKGATSIGILDLMDRAAKAETSDEYDFQMATAADELMPLLVKGDLDIALLPANAAAVLYAKTEGEIQAIDINTQGVLYFVTGKEGVESVSDLKGRTIYLTGKGTTPEASLRYIMSANGLTESDYTAEFKSEATEVAVLLAENPEAVGLLPQPFVTAALMQNDALRVVLDMNEEWKKTEGAGGNDMVTGVTVVRTAFLEQNPKCVERFLKEHEKSAAACLKDNERAAKLAVEAGIIAKKPVALKAIPKCGIVYRDGAAMKESLSAYLKVLEEFKPELVGGKIPDDNFYYLGR